MRLLPEAPSATLDGRRALVTGAGRGIGVALASALAKAGAEVWLVSRTESEIHTIASAIIAAGGRATPLQLDVTDLPAVELALSAIPVVDILVNNAGTNRPRPIGKVSVDDYDAVFGLNVRATYFLTRLVVARLVDEGRGGSVINITSQMGHVGAVNRTLYCASKHAVEGFTKALAIELAPAGIRVNAIAPTFIETSMTRPFFDADRGFEAEVLSKIKLGRLGRPEDLMGAVVYLASDASSMVTGTSLVIDGGWTAE